MKESIAVGGVAAGSAALACLSAAAEVSLTSMVGPDPAATAKRFRELTDARIAEIRATPNGAVPAGCDVYYLSKDGDDARDGRTPATAWLTVGRLNRATDIRPGSFVLFERGGTWRTSLDLAGHPADKPFTRGPGVDIIHDPFKEVQGSLISGLSPVFSLTRTGAVLAACRPCRVWFSGGTICRIC